MKYPILRKIDYKYKYLFLDVDGVILTQRAYIQSTHYCPGLEKILQEGGQTNQIALWFCHSTQKRLHWIATIQKKTHCKIILVSSWRYQWNSNRGKVMMEAFKSAGISVTSIMPLKMGQETRGQWILRTANEHGESTNWVVIDDDLMDEVADHQIQPWFIRKYHIGEGLRHWQVRLAIKMLNTKRSITRFGSFGPKLIKHKCTAGTNRKSSSNV